jgi:quercetin dioxygenase-like cupin family protein
VEIEMSLPILNAQNAIIESLGLIKRHVMFSPVLQNSRYMKMALVVGQPSAESVAHNHLGNEAIYTLYGEIIVTMNGIEYLVGAGQALVIPPDTTHQAKVAGDAPWASICFYCDECPLLVKYRASGGRPGKEQPRVVSESEVEAEQLGELNRHVLLTPSKDGVNFLRIGTAGGPQGAKGAVHTHRGNECFFTLEGQGTLLIDGEPHVVNESHGMCIPPDTEHPLAVTGGGWKAVAAYCDECPLLEQEKSGQ